VAPNSSLPVIAGLDPAIHGRGAALLDRRVKPGDDRGVVPFAV